MMLLENDVKEIQTVLNRLCSLLLTEEQVITFLNYRPWHDNIGDLSDGFPIDDLLDAFVQWVMTECPSPQHSDYWHWPLSGSQEYRDEFDATFYARAAEKGIVLTCDW